MYIYMYVNVINIQQEVEKYDRSGVNKYLSRDAYQKICYDTIDIVTNYLICLLMIPIYFVMIRLCKCPTRPVIWPKRLSVKPRVISVMFFFYIEYKNFIQPIKRTIPIMNHILYNNTIMPKKAFLAKNKY